MKRKARNILGLKITGPAIYFDDKGEKKSYGPVVGFAQVKEVDQVKFIDEKKEMKKIENITEQEVIDTARKQIGSYLNSIREEKELTYYAVGKRAGLAIAQVQAIEAGDSSYTIDTFLRICRALDCYFLLKNRDGNHLNEEHFESKIGED